MPVCPGTRLGVHEVTAQIGEGGMRQVYRDADTTLDRDVATALLLAAGAHDADWLARWTRDAQVPAPLSHPDIAAIHSLGKIVGLQKETRRARPRRPSSQQPFMVRCVLLSESTAAGQMVTVIAPKGMAQD